jgi:hypothetical protein
LEGNRESCIKPVHGLCRFVDFDDAFMDPIERWKLADELTVYQIAFLIAGYDPAEFEQDEPHHWPDQVKRDISPFLNAVKNAARSGKLIVTLVKYDTNYTSDEIDWERSTVNIDSLCDWLRLRNFPDGFFISTDGQVDKIADEANEFYAPKLAAAVRAWTEVTTDPGALNGKSPKKALEIWLRKHANEYGLTGKDGNPNELGIEEICKVANWKPSGGATPTPVSASVRSVFPTAQDAEPRAKTDWVRKVRSKSPTRFVRPHPQTVDDDIPF